jgi:hypothetical protein
MIISYLLIHITNRTTRTITMITANGIRAPRILKHILVKCKISVLILKHTDTCLILAPNKTQPNSNKVPNGGYKTGLTTPLFLGVCIKPGK